MTTPTLAAALEREHAEIDAGIAAFAGAPGERDAAPLHSAVAALRRHIYLEEEFLFPALKAAGLLAPVFVMLREHGQIWQTLDEFERAVADGSGEPLLCHRLAVELQHHNLKEERILYPVAEDALGAEASARLQAFLGAGEMPEGWVCERAPSRR